MATFRTIPFRGLVYSVVVVLGVVSPFFLLPSLMSGPARPALTFSTNPFLTFPNDTPNPLNSVGGWAVRQACRYPLDVLFFVHSAPDHWQHRAVYRDTLASPMATDFFNWTAVYFVGESTDDHISKLWNRLEADSMGDLVILPFLDTYRNLSFKFLGGMQWVAQNCPLARFIVKIDDDLFVEPNLLQWYMLSNMTADSRQLHCYIWSAMHAYRDPASPWYVPVDLFPATFYYTYCSGRSVVMTTPVMRDLYRWSSVVPPYSVDDAYVTGDLALAAGVGHVNMQEHITWTDEQAYGVLDGRYVFAHVSCGYAFVMRRALWHLTLWQEAWWNGNLRKAIFNSEISGLLRDDFETTRAYFKKGYLSKLSAKKQLKIQRQRLMKLLKRWRNRHSGQKDHGKHLEREVYELLAQIKNNTQLSA